MGVVGSAIVVGRLKGERCGRGRSGGRGGVGWIVLPSVGGGGEALEVWWCSGGSGCFDGFGGAEGELREGGRFAWSKSRRSDSSNVGG